MGRKALELQGKRFGSLVVVGPAESDGPYTRWECICDCGRVKSVRGSHLTRGEVKSCGQKAGAVGCLYLGLPTGALAVIRQYKKGARSRGYTWELSQADALGLLRGDCHYCGSQSGESRYSRQEKKRAKRFAYGGIDRKNSELGYSIDNCVACCAVCNYMKSAMPYDDFLDAIKRIYENRLKP